MMTWWFNSSIHEIQLMGNIWRQMISELTAKGVRNSMRIKNRGKVVFDWFANFPDPKSLCTSRIKILNEERKSLSKKSKTELDWIIKLSFPKSFPCQKLCLSLAWYYRVCPRLVMKIRGSCKRELYWWHPHHPLNLKRSVTFWQKTNSVRIRQMGSW